MKVFIEKALNQARTYIEESFIMVSDAEKAYWAFPHFRGKNRVTECGGTSSALAALSILHTSSTDVQQKVDSALNWLYRRQRADGSWESSGLYCSEVTARILCDIKDYNPPSKVVDLAIEYILSCYDKNGGYFSSTPDNREEPHIYSTYICLKALHLYNKDGQLIEKAKIKDWISNSVSIEGNWGDFPKQSHGTIAHTIFSLYILSYCGVSFEAIKKNNKSSIIWLKRQITNIENKYDADEIRIQNGCDNLGTTYYTLKIGHNCLALLGELLLELNLKYQATIIAKKIILSQHSGGWGPAKDKTTMWAIEYNVDYLSKYRELFINLPNFLKLIYSINSLVGKVVICSIGILFFVGNIVWICIDLNRLESAYLSLFISLAIMIGPWLFNVNHLRL